jgi:hypothetical protein
MTQLRPRPPDHSGGPPPPSQGYEAFGWGIPTFAIVKEVGCSGSVGFPLLLGRPAGFKGKKGHAEAQRRKAVSAGEFRVVRTRVGSIGNGYRVVGSSTLFR